MCLACEQDAMWFAYLRRRGLITPDGRFVEEPPLVAGAVELPPTQGGNEEESAAEPADKSKFSCDDPKAG